MLERDYTIARKLLDKFTFSNDDWKQLGVHRVVSSVDGFKPVSAEQHQSDTIARSTADLVLANALYNFEPNTSDLVRTLKTSSPSWYGVANFRAQLPTVRSSPLSYSLNDFTAEYISAELSNDVASYTVIPNATATCIADIVDVSASPRNFLTRLSTTNPISNQGVALSYMAKFLQSSAPDTPISGIVSRQYENDFGSYEFEAGKEELSVDFLMKSPYEHATTEQFLRQKIANCRFVSPSNQLQVYLYTQYLNPSSKLGAVVDPNQLYTSGNRSDVESAVDHFMDFEAKCRRGLAYEAFVKLHTDAKGCSLTNNLLRNFRFPILAKIIDQSEYAESKLCSEFLASISDSSEFKIDYLCLPYINNLDWLDVKLFESPIRSLELLYIKRYELGRDKVINLEPLLFEEDKKIRNLSIDYLGSQCLENRFCRIIDDSLFRDLDKLPSDKIIPTLQFFLPSILRNNRRLGAKYDTNDQILQTISNYAANLPGDKQGGQLDLQKLILHSTLASAQAVNQLHFTAS